jgi:dUTP pyrophosphatase
MFKDFYLNIELLEGGIMPTRAHDTDAGLDFYTPISFVIPPKSDYLISLQLKTEFPRGYALKFTEKSGLMTKEKIKTGGLIDCDYRGVLKAQLFNLSNDYVHFDKGMKVVQGIIFPVWDGQPKQVENIEVNTKRGVNGFGSTGK